MVLLDSLRGLARSQSTVKPSSVIAQEQEPATTIWYNISDTASMSSLAPSTTMSWTGQSGVLIGNAVNNNNADPLIARNVSQTDPPPDYSQTSIPLGATTYTFSPPHKLQDSVLLLPPDDMIDTRPLFHISASMNPFVPNAITTLIKRGNSGDGEDVADFEWGSTVLPPSIRIRDIRQEYSQVMKRVKLGSQKSCRKPEPAYDWNWDGDGDHRLFWYCHEHTATCYLQTGPDPPARDERLRLAEFAGRPLLTFRYPQSQPPMILKVYPDGHIGPRLVYILLSALLIERNRLWPGREMK